MRCLGQARSQGASAPCAAAAATAGQVAAQAQHAAEQVLGWAGRFPIKIAGWGDVSRAVPLASGATPVALTVRSQA